MKKVFYSICISLFVMSCSGKFDEVAIRDTTNQFFTNIQNQNWTVVNQIYPNFSKITSYHNFINYAIEDMIYEKDKGICVNIDLEYLTNRQSPSSHYKMKLYFDKNKETKIYYIKDSQSFAMFERDGYLYQYAVKTGCLNELNDVMDIAISEKLIAANEMYNYYFGKIEEEVKSAIKISKKRTNAYGWYEYLKVRVTNDSKYDLHNLRYNASWRWKSQNISQNYTNRKLFEKNLKADHWVEFNPYDGEEVREDAIDTFNLIFDDAVHYILQNEITYQGDEYKKYLSETQNTTSEIE